jgi:hypothetical protein
MQIDAASQELFDVRLDSLKARCGSWKAVAECLGVSPAYLCDVLHGRREPGAGILAPLGLERVVFYREHAEKD